MDVIAGTGPVHDALFAAALRARGRPAEACRAPTDASLSLGRALLPRGHPCTVYYLAGAMVEHGRERPGPLRFVTPGDRCGAYATDLRAALRAAGLGGEVWAPAPEREPLEGGPLGPLGLALLDALSAGDVLRAAASARRSGARAPGRVNAWLREATGCMAEALERGGDVLSALRAQGEALRAIPRGGPARCAVRVTGELLPTAYDGDPGGSLVRWLEGLGARVQAPSLGEWALYRAWRGAPEARAYDTLRSALRRALGRCARALGVRVSPPVDPAAWVEEARRWLPVGASAGSGFLELAVWLSVERARSASLVLSLKPLASITSSAVSDAVLQRLAREGRTGFLALELNGDADAQLRSRVELALDVHCSGRAAPRRRLS